MNCPRCSVELKPVKIKGIELDICDTCEGIWFDNGELDKVCNLGESSLETSDISKSLIRDNSLNKSTKSKTLTCPHCNSTLERFIYSYDSNILLDACKICHGIWLDDGELKEVIDYVYRFQSKSEVDDELDKRFFEIRKNINKDNLHNDFILFLKGLFILLTNRRYKKTTDLFHLWD